MMSEGLIEREVKALNDLRRLADARAKAEAETTSDFDQSIRSAEKAFQEKLAKLREHHRANHQAMQQEYQAALRRVEENFAREFSGKQGMYTNAREKTRRDYEAGKAKIHEQADQARWEINAVYQAQRSEAKKEYNKVKFHEKAVRLAIRDDFDQMTKLLEAREFPGLLEAVNRPNRDAQPDDALHSSQQWLNQAKEFATKIERVRLPGFLLQNRFMSMAMLAWAASVLPLIFFFKWLGRDALVGFVVSVVFIPVLATVLYFFLKRIAKNALTSLLGGFVDRLARGERVSLLAVQTARDAYLANRKDRRAWRQSELETAKQNLLVARKKIRVDRKKQSTAIEEQYPQLLEEIKQKRDKLAWELNARYPKQLEELEKDATAAEERMKSEFETYLSDANSQRERNWNTLVNAWPKGMSQIAADMTAIAKDCEIVFPEWSEVTHASWKPPISSPKVLRLGTVSAPLSIIPNGVPQDERLKSGVFEKIVFPALLPFPSKASLLLKANQPGKEEAVQLVQSVLFRLISSIPPGKVKFTIIDPYGLGQNFSAFMHLADHDESLVTNRIWTEASHIEQRLADLTAHMENVIQKYLRNEYPTIEEYNAQAGEIAEPFRFLVIADFPVNFTENAARRLTSILTSGARCGVYVILTVDPRAAMPPGFHLAEIEPHMTSFSWNGLRFVWKNAEFGAFTFAGDRPPTAQVGAEMLQRIGALAKDASRVVVPFDNVAPPEDKWWTFDSRHGLSVPLGPCGAHKVRALKLGQGTSQHVLTAGKTGSGKSTLLHTLITNLTLMYGPDEVELYLVDFKKGVEFKTYASHQLPHARVIAIESEREFGLSVLQRLDAELRVRGERFRELGVHDLAGYRTANPQAYAPRVFLIVDEFQEFFTEDDKIGQEASLLLDRLVRQGRAFGLHVMLGSQTLSGAYSLARSTLGQMAIRIALQCSEADAHLILSEDNKAARLLARPGEAIYNDANGLIEGNTLFQIAYLSEDRREELLPKLRSLARTRPPRGGQQIVFEGNAPADLANNLPLMGLLFDESRPSDPRNLRVWLGDAVAIKDPTSTVFRRQTGANLLIVGQHEAAAMGMMQAALLSLASQLSRIAHERNGGPEFNQRIFLLDGCLEDSPLAGQFERLVNVLPPLARRSEWREVQTVVGLLADEVQRRQKNNEVEASALFLFIYDGQRFRDLRKQDDDFGFGRNRDEKPHPSKLLATILRDGPAVGVHVILWCDSLNTANRMFERTTLREFETRVLLQMSVADSSALIDSPIAGKLGPHRALFSSEEQGRLEKFRPYGVLDDALMARLSDRPAPHQPTPAGV